LASCSASPINVISSTFFALYLISSDRDTLANLSQKAAPCSAPQARFLCADTPAMEIIDHVR
jgi:hypothetical protein